MLNATTDNGRNGQQHVVGEREEETCKQLGKQPKEETVLACHRHAQIPQISRQEIKNVGLNQVFHRHKSN